MSGPGILLAAGNNITLSQSSGFGGTTMSIIGAAGGGGGGVDIADSVHTISSGTLVFSNSNGVSFGLNGSTMTASDINSNGNFSWTPQSQDAGSHTITVDVTDSQGHSQSASETVTIVSTPTTSIGGLSPGSAVAIGSPLTFTVAASGFSSPNYTVSDSFAGSSVSNADINSSGAFNWTPTASDAGVHNFTVYVSDSSGHNANVSEQITVETPNVAVTSISPSSVVTVGTPLTITASAVGFINPTYSLSDPFSGSSLTSGNINSSGVLTWTPASNDVGVHTITISATDTSGHNQSTSVSIEVESVAGTTVTTSSSETSNLSQTQIQSILSVLQSFGADQSVINSVSAALGEQTTTITASASSATSDVFNTYLSPGITNNQVTELQNLLAKLGFFSGTATGYYGSETENAVIAFQAAHGISQLGVVGPATQAALNTIKNSSSSSTGDGYAFNNFIGIGSSGTDVTELQKRLTALGDYSGPVTGYFGTLTQSAVKQFQTAHEILPVGYVGPGTRAALN